MRVWVAPHWATPQSFSPPSSSCCQVRCRHPGGSDWGFQWHPQYSSCHFSTSKQAQNICIYATLDEEDPDVDHCPDLLIHAIILKMPMKATSSESNLVYVVALLASASLWLWSVKRLHIHNHNMKVVKFLICVWQWQWSKSPSTASITAIWSCWPLRRYPEPEL